MKHLLALLALTLTGYAQGLVNFYNTPSTLISVYNPANGTIAPAGFPVGSFEFALLTSPVGANNFSFAGIYATNTTTPGMINGGSGVAVPGWAPGTTRDYVVFGWAASISGVLYDPGWLNPDLSLGRAATNIYFGLSSPLVSGIAGGVTGTGTVPALSLFGGPSGIQNGFVIVPSTTLPEPSSIALLCLGAAVLLIRYRRKRTTP